MMIIRPYRIGYFMIWCLWLVLILIGTGVKGQTWTTISAGNWSNPGTWTTNTVPPTGSTMGTVTIAHSVTLDQNAIIATLNINAGVLTVSGASTLTVSGTATIANGATFTNSSSNASKVSISSFVVSNGGTYNHDAVGSSSTGSSNDFPGTSKIFGATSNVVITKWANGGTPVALPIIASPGWGNLTINVSSLGGTYWQQNGNLTRVQGDFTLKNSANKEITLFNYQSGGTTFSKNVNIEGGSLCILQNGNANGINITINGNLSMSGTGKLTLTTSAGAFNFFSTSEPRVFLKGDLSITNTAQILQPNTAGVVAIFVFTKTSGIQYFTCSNPNGINAAYIGWGIGDRNGAGVFTNTLRLNSNFIAIDLCVFRVYKNATLDCPGELFIKGARASGPLIGSPGFTLYDGSTIKIGSANGITAAGALSGNIQTSGARNYNANANYIYTGAYNQVTGNGLPTTITGTLSVSNTGAANNNIVTLTTNNTETKTLNLNSGYFAAGTGQTLKISNTGTINGSAGGDCIHLTPNGGNIHLLGNNTVTGLSFGYPHFYDVTIGSGIAGSPVTFSQNGTIYHYCTINNGGTVDPKPTTYAPGSTLIYNPGSTYNRGFEWTTASVGAPGYPWHVLVKNGTNLNLGTSAPPLLECGGNLTIGILGGGSGTVNMNSLSQPLIVKGHLTIGDTITGAPIGTLNLSNSTGGDLYLYGNFSRGKNSIYTDNSRAIFFKGSDDVSVNTPAISITPGVPSQYFSNARIDKTSGMERITLNCPLGINNEISFIKGVVTSTATNLLTVTNANVASVVGGSNLSFVNGPITRAVNSANEYQFPVGKTGISNTWRPVSVLPSSNSSSSFLAEYFKGPTPNNTFLLGSISSLQNNEYWNINRPSGTASAVIKLNYQYPGPGTSNWFPVDPCAGCSVAVAQYNTAGSGYWDLTKSIASLDPNVPEKRLNVSNGPLYSDLLSNFSLSRPFTSAAYFTIILPVKLLSFTGRIMHGYGKLEWKVADAKDLEGFELQLSRDGRSYQKLVTIKSNGGNYYNYLDASLLPGTNYYRLLVKDKNGKSFYSQVVLLEGGDLKTFFSTTHPTVVRNEILHVIFSAKNQALQIRILDVMGRRILSKNLLLHTGSNSLRLQTQTMPKGIYFLSIISEDGIKETRKFIKD